MRSLLLFVGLCSSIHALTSTTCSQPSMPCESNGSCQMTTDTCTSGDRMCCDVLHIVESGVNNVVTTPSTRAPGPSNSPGPTAAPGPGTGCVDGVHPVTGVTNCPQLAYLCTNAVYYDLMTQQCPKTCNRCGAVTTPPTPTCVDKVHPTTGKSNCPETAYLCNNTIYYTLMTEQCPKTCNRCPTGK